MPRSIHVAEAPLLERTESAPAVHTQTTRGLDQVISIETPEQVVFSYTVAGLGSRAAAALIDHAILLAALLGLGLLYAFVLAPALGSGSGIGALGVSAGAWALAVVYLVQFALLWGYYVLFEALWDGQTPGKRLLGLRVVQDGGFSVTFAASAARNIARILDLQPVFAYVVGTIAVVVSKTGKRTGDQLAGTIVVRERLVRSRAEDASEPAVTEQVRGLTAALSEDEMELLKRFLDRADALDAARRSQLAERLAARFRSHIGEADDPIAALQALLASEQAARAQGLSGRGETGAARERYALLAEGDPRWTRFATRLADAQKRGLHHMSADDVATFVAEYREVATDLARLSTAARGRDLDALFRLSRLVAGGHNLLYRQDRVALRAIGRFLLRTVPAELRRSVRPILAAAVLLFGSGVITFIAVVRNPVVVERLMGPGMIDRAEVDAARAAAGDVRYIDIERYERPLLASQVVTNNVQVTFAVFASGLTAGLLTVFLLLMNGISIGAAIGLFATKGIGRLIADFIIAHGVLELTAICIAAGGGFCIAGALLLPGVRTRRDALVIQGRRALRLLAAAVLMLLAAGAIEGLISPRTDLGFPVKAAVAVVSGLLILAYSQLGRGVRSANDGSAAPYSEARALIAR